MEPAHQALQVQRIPIADLMPDPRNPRNHDARNLDSIQRSLAEHGQVEPLVVQASNYMVIGGNGRMQAMQTLGWDEADCVVLDVDDTQARRLSITLNRTAELADWDLGTLTAHLDELQGDQFDPEDLGFSDEEFTRLLSDFGEALPPEPELPQGDDSNDKGLPPGTEAGHLPSSSARMVQLFLDEETEPLVRLWAKRLAEEYETDNLTDTIFECMRRVARGRGWLDDGGTE